MSDDIPVGKPTSTDWTALRGTIVRRSDAATKIMRATRGMDRESLIYTIMAYFPVDDVERCVKGITRDSSETSEATGAFIIDPDEEQPEHKPGIYLVNEKLFFALLDGSAICCDCIGEPYASKIVKACKC